jgi:hypothetical protein
VEESAQNTGKGAVERRESAMDPWQPWEKVVLAWGTGWQS